MSHRLVPSTIQAFIVCAATVGLAQGATPDRLKAAVDTHQIARISSRVHPLAQQLFDQGRVAPAFRLDSMILMVKPSSAQQADLNKLLADQQNPSSPQFHKWLTPEQFGERFGLSTSDHSKVVAWLHSAGFQIHESGRARNWVAFGGTAEQVERTLHTQIHRYRVNGATHYANADAPAVPAAIADAVAGFVGLDDFNPHSNIQTIQPEFNSGTTHYIVPEDFATIYNLAPLYQNGIDGTGVNIGIIGDSALQMSDLQAFRAKYNLPPSDPKLQLTGTSPGITGDLIEANLDLEWAGALAPNATVYYYYASSVFNAIVSAINANAVHVLSISFGAAELSDFSVGFQPLMQQANAQGITVMAASGDQGAATFPDGGSNATRGPAVNWLASFPEVTAVGGTQFNEGTGTYWATTNSANSGSALSYIPEIAWPAGGGGASLLYPKPDWQTGPGVPTGNARYLPDISLSASSHDGYYISYLGIFTGVGGTSASSPSFAAITALLNQYLVANGGISKPGLGNINPQLYRLAQTTPAAFHDIVGGTNAVTCIQGSQGCLGQTFGYSAAPGYDLATGLGSVDANVFVTSWSNATSATSLTLTVDPGKISLNESAQLVANVASISGSGTPGGIVDFSTGTTTSLGSAKIDPASGNATLSVSGWRLGSAATYTLLAHYRGDAAFSPSGSSAKLQVTTPTGVSSVVPSVAPLVVSTNIVTITLRERGGVAALLTGLSETATDAAGTHAIPVQLSSLFPSPNIPPNSTVISRTLNLKPSADLTFPYTLTFVFTGTDAGGQNWTRDASITVLAALDRGGVLLTGVPLTVQPNTLNSQCRYPQQIVLSETGGGSYTISDLKLSRASIRDQIIPIFGTDRLGPYRSLQGTVCWDNPIPGNSDVVEVDLSGGVVATLTASFSPGPELTAKATADPPKLTLQTDGDPAHTALNVTVPGDTPWTATVLPQNRWSGWLSLSPRTGRGNGQITLTADGAGYAKGVYLATVVIQAQDMAAVTVPVVFLFGDASKITIDSLTNTASGLPLATPGMTATIKGAALSTFTSTATTAGFTSGLTLNGTALNYALTVNGLPAAYKHITPTQIDFQIPYETGAGPAVVGINQNGSVGAFLFDVTPSAPAIFTPATSTVQAGKTLTITMTGDGTTAPSSLPDGATPSTLSNLAWKPALPVSVTIGGIPAFINSYGIASGAVGVTTLNLVVPTSVPAGVQPVVVTVGGVDSPPANVTVTPAP